MNKMLSSAVYILSPAWQRRINGHAQSHRNRNTAFISLVTKMGVCTHVKPLRSMQAAIP